MFGGNPNLHPSIIFLFLQADPIIYVTVQRKKDSQGYLEEDLDHRYQCTHNVTGIKICGLG